MKPVDICEPIAGGSVDVYQIVARTKKQLARFAHPICPGACVFESEQGFAARLPLAYGGGPARAAAVGKTHSQVDVTRRLGVNCQNEPRTRLVGGINIAFGEMPRVFARQHTAVTAKARVARGDGQLTRLPTGRARR